MPLPSISRKGEKVLYSYRNCTRKTNTLKRHGIFACWQISSCSRRRAAQALFRVLVLLSSTHKKSAKYKNFLSRRSPRREGEAQEIFVFCGLHLFEAIMLPSGCGFDCRGLVVWQSVFSHVYDLEFFQFFSVLGVFVVPCTAQVFAIV